MSACELVPFRRNDLHDLLVTLECTNVVTSLSFPVTKTYSNRWQGMRNEDENTLATYQQLKWMSLKFRLRTAFIVVAVVAAPLTWIGCEVRSARIQQSSILELQRGGASVFYEYEPAQSGYVLLDNKEPQQGALREWARSILGDELGGRVVKVAFEKGVTEDDLQTAIGLPFLQEVEIVGATLSEELGSHLSNARGLKRVRLVDCEIDDRALNHLAAMHWLEELDVVPVSGSYQFISIAALREVDALRRLSIRFATIDPQELLMLSDPHKLRALRLSHCRFVSPIPSLDPFTSLRELCLNGCPISSSELRLLQFGEQLEGLNLSDLQITDSDIVMLSRFNGLRVLGLDRTAITQEGVERLQSNLRGCEVWARHTDPLYRSSNVDSGFHGDDESWIEFGNDNNLGDESLIDGKVRDNDMSSEGVQSTSAP